MSFWTENFWTPGFWSPGFWTTGTEVGTVPTISIDQGAATTVRTGLTRQLTATVDGSPTPTVTWESDDELIATVDEDGLVTGVAEGSCTITATATNTEGSDDDTITVEVSDPITNTATGRSGPTITVGIGL